MIINMEEHKKKIETIFNQIELKMNYMYELFKDYSMHESYMDGKIGSAIPNKNNDVDILKGIIKKITDKIDHMENVLTETLQRVSDIEDEVEETSSMKLAICAECEKNGIVWPISK